MSNGSVTRTPALLFNAYVEFAKVGLADVFLINAGSATVLITFLGRPTEPSAKQVANGALNADGIISAAGAIWAIKWYAFGALLAVLGSALLSIQESLNASRLERGEAFGARVGWIAFTLLIASGAAFLLGCFGAVSSPLLKTITFGMSP